MSPSGGEVRARSRRGFGGGRGAAPPANPTFAPVLFWNAAAPRKQASLYKLFIIT
jgi:hypothetical protein